MKVRELFYREQGVAEGRVQQLPTRGADYSNYDTDHLKMMLRPGILHRDEAKFKALIRKELQKREQQSHQGVASDEFTGELDSKGRFTKDTVKNMFGKLSPDAKGVAEGYTLKKTNVEKTFHPGDPEDYGSVDMTRKDTDYEIINNKTGQVVGTASWTTNDYFGPGALKITMKNGATRYLDIWDSEKGNPQSAFNRFVKDPRTSKKYKEQGVAEAKGNLTYTPKPTEYGVFPDSGKEFVKTFPSKDLALAHIKKFGGKLVVMDQHGRRMSKGVAEASSTAAASMHAATRKQSGGKTAQPTHGIKVGDKVITGDGKKGLVSFVHGDEVHVKGTNHYYPDKVTHHSAKDLRKNTKESLDPREKLSKWKVTYDMHGTNRDVPLARMSKIIYAASEKEAIDNLKNLVGGRNIKAELLSAPKS